MAPLRRVSAFVRHDQRRIEIKLRAEPVAGRAGAMRIVEGEQARLDLRRW